MIGTDRPGKKSGRSHHSLLLSRSFFGVSKQKKTKKCETKTATKCYLTHQIYYKLKKCHPIIGKKSKTKTKTKNTKSLWVLRIKIQIVNIGIAPRFFR